MGDENPIRTLGDYSKPSHEGYKNTIELLLGNNVVPLRSDTIRLMQNGCLFHRLWSEDPNQHLKDFLKLLAIGLNVFEHDPSPHGRILLPDSLLYSFHQEGPQNSAMISRCSNNIMENLYPKHGLLRDRNAKESWALLEDLALFDNESWNDPRDFAKPVKAIALPQDVPSTSYHRLIELENKVQRLMEAHLALTQPTQVNKITTSCEICSGPHNTQYCMEDPEQAFVEYASSHADEAGGKWYTFKPEQNNLGDTYNLSWRSHPNLRWRQPQNSQNNFSNPPNWFQSNGSIPNRSFNNNPRSFNNQSNLEGLVSNFMTSQDARLSKFEADFKQQQSEMTNKIDTVLKAITDRIAGALPSDTVKNLKLSASPVLSARSYPNMDPQCSNHVQEEKDSRENIHVNPSTPPDSSVAFLTEKVLKFNSFFESLGLVPQSSDTEVVCTKGDNREVMFIELIRKNDDSSKGEPEKEGSTTTEGVGAEYFDIFPTRSEPAYHKYLMCSPIPSIFLRNPIITEGCLSNLKIPCNIRHVHVEKAYIDPNSPLNIMTWMMYNCIMRRKLDPRENSNRGVSNFIGRIKGMHVFMGNFTYIVDFMIVEDISSIIDPRLS
ncbi:hypothetical protein Tco_1423887 [Tanacetum coccineum]